MSFMPFHLQTQPSDGLQCHHRPFRGSVERGGEGSSSLLPTRRHQVERLRHPRCWGRQGVSVDSLLLCRITPACPGTRLCLSPRVPSLTSTALRSSSLWTWASRCWRATKVREVKGPSVITLPLGTEVNNEDCKTFMHQVLNFLASGKRRWRRTELQRNSDHSRQDLYNYLLMFTSKENEGITSCLLLHISLLSLLL